MGVNGVDGHDDDGSMVADFFVRRFGGEASLGADPEASRPGLALLLCFALLCFALLCFALLA